VEYEVPVRWILVILLLSGGVLCRADILWQKSGRSLDVMILNETSNQVTFTVGTGQITIPRNQIDRVEYSSAAEKQKLLSKWMELYFYDDQYVPEGLETLADLFRQLRSSHAQVAQALLQRTESLQASDRAAGRMPECALQMERLRPQVDQMAGALQADRMRLDKLTGQMNELSGAYQSGDLSSADRKTAYSDYESLRKQRDPFFLQVQQKASEYRVLASQLDALRVEYQELIRVQTSSGQGDSDRSELVNYLKHRTDFQDELQRCKALKEASHYELSLNRFSEADARMDADVRQDHVSVLRRGGTLQTTVVLNGGSPAVMIVDTGASYTTISRKFTEQLDLGPLDQLPCREVRMADGRSVQAAEIRLVSVQVGTVTRADVTALIMDEPPSPGVDGLLGMSFLKNFVMRMDTDKSDLELISLREPVSGAD
jgi:clan AA aspartic protease (TIGR02281 family)